jgi:cyclopropane fatty-acyl-phospholipid synthase-like methyltransferase
MFTNKEIAKHFEVCEDHYRYWWNLSESRSMHYGYWREDTKSLHEALMNINQVMADKIGISEKDTVLDAGCGVGGSSFWIAANRGAAVTGITLSAKQRQQAEDHATKLGLSQNVNFQNEDFTNTNFSSASFDAIWGIESICYAEKKIDFLKEAFRLLKPGGRIIVADFFKQQGLQGKDKTLMDQMAYGWAISDFATIEDFVESAKAVGFTKIKIDDISIQITPSARRLYWFSIPGMFISKLYAIFFSPTELSKHHAKTVYLQYKGLKRNLWHYSIFQAEK